MLAVEKRVTSPLLVRAFAGPCSRRCGSGRTAAGWAEQKPASKPRQRGRLRASLARPACRQHPPRAALLPFPQEPSSIQKVAEIDEHIGCAMSGLTADAKTLIDHARAETQVGAWPRRAACSRGAAWAGPAHCQQAVLVCWKGPSTLGAASADPPDCDSCQVVQRGQLKPTPPQTHLAPSRRPLPQSHRFSYNEPMPLESCTQSLCDLALQFGEDDDEGGGGGMVGGGKGAGEGRVPRMQAAAEQGDGPASGKPRAPRADARHGPHLHAEAARPPRRAGRLAWRC